MQKREQEILTQAVEGVLRLFVAGSGVATVKTMSNESVLGWTLQFLDTKRAFITLGSILGRSFNESEMEYLKIEVPKEHALDFWVDAIKQAILEKFSDQRLEAYLDRLVIGSPTVFDVDSKGRTFQVPRPQQGAV